MPTTNKIYDQYIKKTRQLPDTVNLGNGALGHWVGDKNAENVLVWYHGKILISNTRIGQHANNSTTGGGFSLPANLGYFNFFARIIEDMRKAGKSICVFSLTYTLAPHATYPTQLRQAVECLRHVLEKPTHAPRNVFIGGDSAGGNLVGGVLSHIAHPHPQISPLSIDENLGGAIMVAPWTMLETDFPEEDIYAGGDLITQAVAKPWASTYLGSAKRDYYTDLSLAPSDWYHDFKVNSVLITGGGNEILLPIIKDFAAKFQAGFSPVEFFIGKRECHVAPIYNLYIGDSTETQQGKRMKEWLRENL